MNEKTIIINYIYAKTVELMASVYLKNYITHISP